MSDSTSILDLIESSELAKEITANELFDAMAANALFGRRAKTTAGLTWGYYGGKWAKSDGSILVVASDTLALNASATNYVYADDTGLHVTTAAPAGWPAPLAAPKVAVYEIVCGAGGVTSYIDYRAPLRGRDGADGAAAASPLTTKGDLWGFGAADARVPVGTNGQRLAADSTQPNGVKWVNEPFDVTPFYPGVPTPSAKILRVPVARAVAFPANFAGSQAIASVAATAATVFDIAKNGVSVGSITFAAGATVGTFTSSGGAAVNLAAGDRLSITAPASPDATLADVGVALAGTR